MSEASTMLINKPYIYEDVDRHGNVRIYFWRGKGHKKYRVRTKRGTAEFDALYHEWLQRSEVGEFKAPPRDTPIPGTLRSLGVQYITSGEFQDLEPRTQRVTQLILDGIYAESIAPGAKETFGDCPIKKFGPKAVTILRDRKKTHPEGANNRIRRLRAMFKWSMLPSNAELGVTANPARDVPFLKPKRQGGFPVWEPKDIDTFEDHHQIGTRPRLAMALLRFTGARRSDVVRLGRQHCRIEANPDTGAPERWLKFTAHKGRNRKPVTVDIPILPELQEAIDATPTGDLAFLVTEAGKPFTAAGFGGWFRERCNEAGLPHLSAHGMRKAAATKAAENGASVHALMAMFGWLTIKQAEAYTRTAERKRLARDNMHRVGTNQVTIFPTLGVRKPLVGKKGAKS